MSRRTAEKIPEQGDPSQPNQWTTTFTYTDFNAVATRTDARGVVTTNTYDTLNRLTQVSYNTVSGVTTAPTVTYNYDSYNGMTANGKLIRVGVGTDYEERNYHGFSIATPASLKNGAVHTIHVKFAGTTTDLSGSPKTVTCGNYRYDAAGNVTNDGQHTFQYDGENRLVSVDSGATASYGYDHQNRRYKTTVGSTVTHYVWQGGKVLAEHNGSTGAVLVNYIGSTGAVLVNYIYAGSRMIAKIAGSTTNYFLNDQLSARLTMNTSGAVTGRQAHLPFGEDFAESDTQQKQHFSF